MKKSKDLNPISGLAIGLFDKFLAAQAAEELRNSQTNKQTHKLTHT